MTRLTLAANQSIAPAVGYVPLDGITFTADETGDYLILGRQRIDAIPDGATAQLSANSEGSARAMDQRLSGGQLLTGSCVVSLIKDKSVTINILHTAPAAINAIADTNPFDESEFIFHRLR